MQLQGSGLQVDIEGHEDCTDPRDGKKQLDLLNGFHEHEANPVSCPGASLRQGAGHLLETVAELFKSGSLALERNRTYAGRYLRLGRGQKGSALIW